MLLPLRSPLWVNGMSAEIKIGSFASIRRSLIGAAALIIVDAVVFGSFVFSSLICPIWLLASAGRSVRRRPGWVIALARLAVPVLTLGIVAVNFSIQTAIAEANAGKIIQAVERFRVAKGACPARLTELVPAYIDAVPPAKNALVMNNFLYHTIGEAERCVLTWITVPPFGRRAYDFQSKQWISAD